MELLIARRSLSQSVADVPNIQTYKKNQDKVTVVSARKNGCLCNWTWIMCLVTRKMTATRTFRLYALTVIDSKVTPIKKMDQKEIKGRDD